MLSPPQALLRHGTDTPHRPWLFVRRGWDWRWLSYGEAAGRVAAASELLREGMAEPEAERAGFAYRPEAVPLLLDLAVQAAGATAVPVPEAAIASPEALADEVRRRDCTAWVAPAREGKEPGGPSDLPQLTLPEHLLDPFPPGSRGSRHEIPTARLAEAASGGEVLVEQDGELRLLDTESLRAAAGELAAGLADAGAGGEREILVSWRGLDEPAERVVLTWGLAAGAVVALEPQPEAAVATAAWVRPTLLHVDLEHLAPLRRAAEAYLPPPFGRRDRPFGRLHTLLWTSTPEPLPEELGYFEERGVRLVRWSAGV